MPSHKDYLAEQNKLFNTLALIKGTGRFIRNERKKRNLSLKQLSEMSSVSYYSVYRLEHGGDVRISFLISILHALGYTLAIRQRGQ